MSNGTISTDVIRRSVVLPYAEHWIMRSKVEQRTYRIIAAKPLGEAPPEGYPVIYMLDGNCVFNTMVEALRLQCRRPEKTGVTPAVIVGIGYETDNQFSPDRFYDYTPFPNTSILNKSDGSPLPEQGGAEAFLRFLEEEVKPQIESEFNIDRNRQTLFGHSLGGLFTLYAMYSRPHAFQYYIAGSPSIHWNKEYLQELESAFIDRIKDVPHRIRLLLGVGELEKTHVAGNCSNACQLADRLADLVEYGVQAEYKEFEGEGHVSVLPVLIARALRFALHPKQ
ncbi:alpha/beta hydrolase [Paenibacillus sp. SC116]|uniref:alpha/beta hydrolase n=1 Tax=Paenibacillus sp. SC116 TaxID=2968986 RepID=UPI00215A32BD|nr:alpha/beta hydrolase [Paenibacillus sp. SC116]MCR8842174.1 alpha/beta hydrolase [Paenibacillus sp. SC116]